MYCLGGGDGSAAIDGEPSGAAPPPRPSPPACWAAVSTAPHRSTDTPICRACSRIFASVVAGCLTGIAGITGFKGFGIYLVFHALLAVALLAKTAFQPAKYFASW